MAKSAATLMCLSGDSILMDHRSELGPIDPQIEYPTREGRKREAAEDIIIGFKDAKKQLIKDGPKAVPAYIPLIDKYTIGLLKSCENAIDLSKELAECWLRKYMFNSEENSKLPKTIRDYFASHSATLSHGRSIRIDKCKELGLVITDLRTKEDLSNKIWKLWCLYELHFERSPAHKIYENSEGCTLNKSQQQPQIQIPPQLLQQLKKMPVKN